MQFTIAAVTSRRLCSSIIKVNTLCPWEYYGSWEMRGPGERWWKVERLKYNELRLFSNSG
eukprot:36667-Hanusia_phi.AAC.1